VADLVKVLEAQNIPMNIKKRVDVLKEPGIRNILNVLSYLQAECRESGLRDDIIFRIMISSVFNIEYRDMVKLGDLTYNRKTKTKKNWIDIISNRELMEKNGVIDIEST